MAGNGNWRYGDWMDEDGARSEGRFATVDLVGGFVDLHPYPSYADTWFVSRELLGECGTEFFSSLIREKEWGTDGIVAEFEEAAAELLAGGGVAARGKAVA